MKQIGQEYILVINGTAVACEVSFDFRVQAEELRLAGRTQNWYEFITSQKNGSVSVSGLLDIGAAKNAEEFFTYLDNGTLLDCQLDSLTSTDGNFYFQARITELEISSEVGSFVSFSATFRITGRVTREPVDYRITTLGFRVIHTGERRSVVVL